jgi:hypothetical protein
MLGTVIVATIRTVVPVVVGLALAWLARRGLPVGDELSAQWVTALDVAAVAGYYALVTLLERRVHPWFGVLLGIPRAPSYDVQGEVLASRSQR